MLKFKDSKGNIKFLSRDEDTQPIDMDKIVIDDLHQAATESKDNDELESNKG